MILKKYHLRYSSVRRWTTTAIECFKRGCNCEGCFYKLLLGTGKDRCQMKASVLELVRKLGKPENVITEMILED